MLDVQRTHEVVAHVLQALTLSREDARTIAYDVAHSRTAYLATKAERPQDAQVIAFAGMLRALEFGYAGSAEEMVQAALALGVRTPNERIDVSGTTPACDCEDQVELIYDNCESGVHKQ